MFCELATDDIVKAVIELETELQALEHKANHLIIPRELKELLAKVVVIRNMIAWKLKDPNELIDLEFFTSPNQYYRGIDIILRDLEEEISFLIDNVRYNLLSRIENMCYEGKLEDVLKALVDFKYSRTDIATLPELILNLLIAYSGYTEEQGFKISQVLSNALDSIESREETNEVINGDKNE